MKRYLGMDMARVALVALVVAAASAFGAGCSVRYDDASEGLARVHETEAAGPTTLDGRLLAAADEGENVSYAACWAFLLGTRPGYIGDRLIRLSSKTVPMPADGQEDDVTYIFGLHVEEGHLEVPGQTYPDTLHSAHCVSAKTRLRAKKKAGEGIEAEQDTVDFTGFCEHDFLSDL